MNEKVRKDIIAVLVDVIKSLEKKDVFALREISNKIIHSASIFQDEYSISTAVIVFALSKIIQRENLIDARIVTLLKKATHHLQKYQLNKYSNDIKKLINRISKSDSKLDLYIQHVMDEAHVKKASRIYEHGVSMEQTANLLGITLWELADYAGQTGIGDVKESITDSEKNRIKLVQDFFK